VETRDGVVANPVAIPGHPKGDYSAPPIRKEPARISFIYLFYILSFITLKA
jgi:hypothetical protein